MTVKIMVGDCRSVLKAMPSESVHCVVTSPPYWGLRDYGVDGQIGLEPNYPDFIDTMVDVFREVRRVLRDDGTCWLNLGDSYATGAGRVGNAPGGGDQGERWRGGHEGKHGASWFDRPALRASSQLSDRKVSGIGPMTQPNRMPQPGLKAKDMCGIPWRVAFALQDDGWYLRQDIIWSKPNPMPESVRDRCTKAHEYIFLMSKSERYFYDQESILEDCSQSTHARLSQDVQSQIGSERAHAGDKTNGNMKAVARRGGGNRSHKFTEAYDGGASEHRTKAGLVAFSDKQRKLAEAGSGTKNNDSFDASMAAIMPAKRNKRSVWTVGSEPFSEAHFATFPTCTDRAVRQGRLSCWRHSPGSVRWGRHDGLGRRSAGPRFDPDRAQPGIRGHRRASHQGRRRHVRDRSRRVMERGQKIVYVCLAGWPSDAVVRAVRRDGTVDVGVTAGRGEGDVVGLTRIKVAPPGEDRLGECRGESDGEAE